MPPPVPPQQHSYSLCAALCSDPPDASRAIRSASAITSRLINRSAIRQPWKGDPDVGGRRGLDVQAYINFGCRLLRSAAIAARNAEALSALASAHELFPLRPSSAIRSAANASAAIMNANLSAER